MLKTDKGFERVLFECFDKQVEVRVGLDATSFTGKIVQLEGQVVTLDVSIDRHNSEFVYVPTQSIQYLAHSK